MKKKRFYEFPFNNRTVGSKNDQDPLDPSPDRARGALSSDRRLRGGLQWEPNLGKKQGCLGAGAVPTGSEGSPTAPAHSFLLHR